MRKILIGFVVLTLGFGLVSSLYGVRVNAQQTAPVPQDTSKSFCDEINANVPSYCDERKTRITNGSQGSPLTDVNSPLLGKNSILYRIIQIVTTLTGLASMIMIIVGGFRYVTSGGDSTSTKGAKDTILYAVIGLVVAIFSQTIIVFVLSKL